MSHTDEHLPREPPPVGDFFFFFHSKKEIYPEMIYCDGGEKCMPREQAGRSICRWQKGDDQMGVHNTYKE